MLLVFAALWGFWCREGAGYQEAGAEGLQQEGGGLCHPARVQRLPRGGGNHRVQPR